MAQALVEVPSIAPTRIEDTDGTLVDCGDGNAGAPLGEGLATAAAIRERWLACRTPPPNVPRFDLPGTAPAIEEARRVQARPSLRFVGIPAMNFKYGELCPCRRAENPEHYNTAWQECDIHRDDESWVVKAPRSGLWRHVVFAPWMELAMRDLVIPRMAATYLTFHGPIPVIHQQWCDSLTFKENQRIRKVLSRCAHHPIRLARTLDGEIVSTGVPCSLDVIEAYKASLLRNRKEADRLRAMTW